MDRTTSRWVVGIEEWIEWMDWRIDRWWIGGWKIRWIDGVCGRIRRKVKE